MRILYSWKVDADTLSRFCWNTRSTEREKGKKCILQQLIKYQTTDEWIPAEEGFRPDSSSTGVFHLLPRFMKKKLLFRTGSFSSLSIQRWSFNKCDNILGTIIRKSQHPLRNSIQFHWTITNTNFNSVSICSKHIENVVVVIESI